MPAVGGGSAAVPAVEVEALPSPTWPPCAASCAVVAAIAGPGCRIGLRPEPAQLGGWTAALCGTRTQSGDQNAAPQVPPAECRSAWPSPMRDSWRGLSEPSRPSPTPNLRLPPFSAPQQPPQQRPLTQRCARWPAEAPAAPSPASCRSRRSRASACRPLAAHRSLRRGPPRRPRSDGTRSLGGCSSWVQLARWSCRPPFAAWWQQRRPTSGAPAPRPEVRGAACSAAVSICGQLQRVGARSVQHLN